MKMDPLFFSELSQRILIVIGYGVQRNIVFDKFA